MVSTRASKYTRSRIVNSTGKSSWEKGAVNLFEQKCENMIRPYLSCWKATSVEDVQVIVVLEKRCSHLEKTLLKVFLQGICLEI